MRGPLEDSLRFYLTLFPFVSGTKLSKQEELEHVIEARSRTLRDYAIAGSRAKSFYRFRV